jgi:AcrR family transcriptional regulator
MGHHLYARSGSPWCPACDLPGMPVVVSLTRREREKLARRSEILEAARAVFAEKGYVGATLEEIAHRAQFGKGTLYNYFDGGKEGILRTILDQMYGDLVGITNDHFSPARLSATPMRQLFHDYLVNIFSYYHRHIDVFLIVLKEAHRLMLADEQSLSHYFSEQRVRVLDALRPPLEYGMATGQLRVLPVDALGELILGNIKGCQLHACMAARGVPEPDCPRLVPETQADLLTTILFDGMRAPDAPDQRVSPTNGPRLNP